MFATTGRTYPIYFHYPWTEQDQLDIEMPKGYAFDNAESPQPFGSGDISKYEISVGAATDGSLLVYKRNFYFGGKNSILFPVEAYGPLKNYFEMMHKQDNHTIALKQTATN